MNDKPIRLLNLGITSTRDRSKYWVTVIGDDGQQAHGPIRSTHAEAEADMNKLAEIIKSDLGDKFHGIYAASPTMH